ncbi:MAG: hypothetical protein H5U02_15310 [Clostridia bacterium]|nr:hypothetical protein [Clostridia bacterium]
MKTPHLTPGQIAKETIRAYRRFYLRPSRLKQVAASLRLMVPRNWLEPTAARSG